MTSWQLISFQTKFCAECKGDKVCPDERCRVWDYHKRLLNELAFQDEMGELVK